MDSSVLQCLSTNGDMGVSINGSKWGIPKMDDLGVPAS